MLEDFLGGVKTALWNLATWQGKAVALASSCAAYVLVMNAKIQIWWHQINELYDKVLVWLNQSKVFDLDLGIGYRMANWIFPLTEFFELLGQLVGIAIVCIGVRMGVWFFNLAVQILKIIS